MGIFKKKNKQEEIDDALQDEAYAPLKPYEGIPDWDQRKRSKWASHAITPEELLHKQPSTPPEEIEMQPAGGFSSAAKSLYARVAGTELATPTQQEPQVSTEPEQKKPEAEKPMRSPKAEVESLLSKCRQFLTDETTKEPYVPEERSTYVLESVEDIISGAELKAKKLAAKKYGATSSWTSIEEIRRSAKPAKPTQPIEMQPARPPQKAEPVKLDVVDLEQGGQVMKSAPPPVLDFQFHLADNAMPAAEATQVMPDLTAAAPDDDTNVYSTESQAAPQATVQIDNIFTDIAATRQVDLGDTEEISKTFHLPEDFANDRRLPTTPAEPEEYEEETGFDYDAEAAEGPEYTCLDDAPGIQMRLKWGRKLAGVQVVVWVLCTIALLVLASPVAAAFRAQNTLIFALLGTFVLAVSALTQWSVFKGLRIFAGYPAGADTLCAAAIGFSALQGLLCSLLSAESLVFWPLAGLALLLRAWGKLLAVHRVKTGFKFVATSGEKKAVQFVQDAIATNAIVRDTLDGPALVCAGRRTVNINGFMKRTRSKSRWEKAMSAIGICILAFALAAAVLPLFFEGTWLQSVELFTLVFCLAAPLCSGLLQEMPLKITSKTLADYDAAMPGWSAAERLAEANAVAVDAVDLFPAGTVRLFNMYPLSKNPVDVSLCEAAAVVFSAKSPLSDIFSKIIAGNRSKLPQVDSVHYEDKMGLSGWLGEKRIFVGNRTLMEGHGIKVPSVEVDKKILAKGYFPVYIASGDRPCVLLVVGYEVDDTIAYEVRRLCNTGATLYVNSGDPNITSGMICDYFGIYDDSAVVMSGEGVRAYKHAMNYTESCEAEAVYSGDACGMLAGVTAAFRLQQILTLVMVLSLIGALGGIIAAVGAALIGFLPTIGVLGLFVYELVAVLLCCCVPLVKHP